MKSVMKTTVDGYRAADGQQPGVGRCGQRSQTEAGGVSLFSAKFAQTVYDSKGKELQKASGDLLVQRLNRFNWHTTSPDESLIVADGQDVWVYDPFVEQVTALKLKDAVLNTPLF